jgi:ABC-type Fe3+-hydroxamate transport system substrate-binding protein
VTAPRRAERTVRVVSLVPSATETLLAWGVEPIAVTRFCEQPSLPPVGGTKDPDVAAIAALAPDLVVMCEEENRREDADTLVTLGLAVHVIRIDTVADVGPQLAELAAAIGVDPPPPTEIESVAAPARRRAFVPIWRRPWMTMSEVCYGSSLLSRLGIDNVIEDAADRYPEISLAEAAALGPDLVIAPSEPYPFRERHRAELEAVAPVRFVDGQDLFWWGVRTPDAAIRLSRSLA